MRNMLRAAFLCHSTPKRSTPGGSPTRDGQIQAELCGVFLVFSSTLCWSAFVDASDNIVHEMPFRLVHQIRKESSRHITVAMKDGTAFRFSIGIARDACLELLQKTFQNFSKQAEKGIDVAEPGKLG